MVCFIPTSFNVNEFSSMCERVVCMGVRNIRVQPLMQLGRGIVNWNEIMPSNFQYRLLIRQINSLAAKYGNQLILWGDPMDHIIRFRRYFTELSIFAGIKANGDIDVTPYFPIAVGNIRKHPLREYWNAGLPRVWGLPIIQSYSENYNTLEDFGKSFSGFPKVWLEEDCMFDLIEYMKKKETK